MEPGPTAARRELTEECFRRYRGGPEPSPERCPSLLSDQSVRLMVTLPTWPNRTSERGPTAALNSEVVSLTSRRNLMNTSG